MSLKMLVLMSIVLFPIFGCVPVPPVVVIPIIQEVSPVKIEQCGSGVGSYSVVPKDKKSAC